MQQIAAFNRIVWQCRTNISGRLIGFFLLCSLIFESCYARGPHHPKSDRRAQQQKHINEHLAFETQHIQEDLLAHQIPNQKKVEEMTEDEKNYLYFKVHDLDGNDKLDGLEILYSATHHSSSDQSHHHNHNHNHEQELIEKTDDTGDTHESDQNQLSNDSTSNSDASNLKLLELDEDGQIVNENFIHIVDVLDNFLNSADLNNDGYLTFAEYAAAVKLGNAIVEAEQNPEL